MRSARRHLGLAWPCLGLLGSAATAAAATNLLTHRPIHWWWRFHLLAGHSASWHLFWAGVIVLCVAWVGLGRRLHRGARPRDLVLVGGLWGLPLALGPALFSLDLYSYLADGSLLHHGLNPYRVGPVALRGVHAGALVDAVSTNWRHTTAPYGPLFVWLASGVAALAGSHVAVGVTLMRLPELAGLGLFAVFVPRLARALGADPVRALWLALLSPLTLLMLVGGGHNDALMAGLLVAGVCLAVEGRPLAGIALCALAAMVKLPALAGVAVILVVSVRAVPWDAAGRRLAAGLLVTGAVVLAAGLAAGVGLSWISAGLFSTPQAAHLAITPSTAAAVTVYAIGHGGAPAGVAGAAHGLISLLATVALALSAGAGLWLLGRARAATLARSLGLILLVAAFGGPAGWPWYLTWGLALLAADRVAQRSPWLSLLAVAAVFPVMAGGQVAVPLPQAPRMFVLYALAGIAAALAAAPTSRRRLRRLNAARVGLAEPEAAG